MTTLSSWRMMRNGGHHFCLIFIKPLKHQVPWNGLYCLVRFLAEWNDLEESKWQSWWELVTFSKGKVLQCFLYYLLQHRKARTIQREGKEIITSHVSQRLQQLRRSLTVFCPIVLTSRKQIWQQGGREQLSNLWQYPFLLLVFAFLCLLMKQRFMLNFAALMWFIWSTLHETMW